MLHEASGNGKDKPFRGHERDPREQVAAVARATLNRAMTTNLKPLEHRAVHAVLYFTSTWGKTWDNTFVAQIASRMYGVERAAKWQIKKAGQALGGAARKGVIDYTPGRGSPGGGIPARISLVVTDTQKPEADLPPVSENESPDNGSPQDGLMGPLHVGPMTPLHAGDLPEVDLKVPEINQERSLEEQDQTQNQPQGKNQNQDPPVPVATGFDSQDQTSADFDERARRGRELALKVVRCDPSLRRGDVVYAVGETLSAAKVGNEQAYALKIAREHKEKNPGAPHYFRDHKTGKFPLDVVAQYQPAAIFLAWLETTGGRFFPRPSPPEPEREDGPLHPEVAAFVEKVWADAT